MNNLPWATVISKPQVIESNRPSLASNSVFFFLFSLQIAWSSKITAHILHCFEDIKENKSISMSKRCSGPILAPNVEIYIQLKEVKTCRLGRVSPAMILHLGSSSSPGSEKIPPKHNKRVMNRSQVAAAMSEFVAWSNLIVRSMMSEETTRSRRRKTNQLLACRDH